MKKIVALLLVFVMVFALCGCDSSDYKKAVQLYEEEKYEEAYIMFNGLADYKDSEEWADKALKNKLYTEALIYYDVQEYKTARKIFEQLGDFRDSEYYANDIKENHRVLYKDLEGKWSVQGDMQRGNSYYYFDIENREFVLYCYGNNGWKKSCNFVVTGDKTFDLINLNNFGNDFDDLTRLECELSEDGTIINTPRVCCDNWHCFSPSTHNGFLRFIKFE